MLLAGNTFSVGGAQRTDLMWRCAGSSGFGLGPQLSSSVPFKFDMSVFQVCLVQTKTTLYTGQVFLVMQHHVRPIYQ